MGAMTGNPSTTSPAAHCTGTPALHPDDCARLRDALLTNGFTTDGVRGLLGEAAHAALTRGEPEPAARRTRDAGPLGALVRLFLLGASEPAAALEPILRLDDLVAGGLLHRAGESVRAALDLRPYGEAGSGADPGSGADAPHGDAPGGTGTDAQWYVLSDLDTPAARQDRDHVTGVGGASLTLASSLLRAPVGTALDLGTGCGVQALHASRFAGHVIATDVAPRALAMARATLALSDVSADGGAGAVGLRQGSWLAPVEGLRFDAIITNPPFVPGPGRIDYVYRDSGQAGDAALAGLVGDLPHLLTDGGRAQLLGSWLHVAGEDWPDRVSSWIPPGCDAWIVQREVTDPAQHVGVWQRDAGLDVGSPAARAQAGAWLDWLAAEQVEAIGFGFLLLRRVRPGQAPQIVVEDMPGELDGPLAGELAGWLERVAWLRDHGTDGALLGARLRLSPAATLERYAVSDTRQAGEPAWRDAGAAVVLAGGPQWRHEVDDLAAALLAGCRGDLPLGDLLGLLSFAHDRSMGELVGAALPAVREFVRHGLLLPAGNG